MISTNPTITKVNIPLDVIRPVAEKLLGFLAPYCELIKIAGSIRRQKETVGDIELLAIPYVDTLTQGSLLALQGARTTTIINHLDEQLARMLNTTDRWRIFRSRNAVLEAAGLPPGWDLLKWGERFKRFYLWSNGRYGVIPVDLFLTTPEQWGAIFCIRTGPGDFSQAMVTHLSRNTPYQQREGYLTDTRTGTVVPVVTEQEYFDRAGVAWIPPEQRNVATLRRAIGAWVPPMVREKQAVHSADEGGIVYTTDTDVRASIRARLERRVGLAETHEPSEADPASPGATRSAQKPGADWHAG